MTTERTVTIRPLGYSDLPQVIAIERRAFPTPWSLAMFVLELSKPSAICLAALKHDDPGARSGESGAAGQGRGRRSESHIAGYLICSRYDQIWHLMNIAVDPSSRRLGLASELLAEMIERGGVDSSYTLEVRPSNDAAIALYERFGFVAAGTRLHYYRDTGEDALIMWRTPGETP